MKTAILLLAVLALDCFTLKAQKFGASAPCNINAQDPNPLLVRNYRTLPREATFKYNFYEKDGSFPSCSGVLLNRNTPDNDLGFYFLTAKHCTEDIDYSKDHLLFFNYQSPDGNTGNTAFNNKGQRTSFNNTTGIYEGVQSGYEFTNSGNFVDTGYEYRHKTKLRLVDQFTWGDLALVEILTPIPPHFNISYAGWNPSHTWKNGVLPNENIPDYGFDDYAGIHHPKGDIKKISTAENVIWPTNLVATGCRVVAVIVDFLFGWIWGHTWSTQTICDWVEVPYMSVVFGGGIVQPGSSGSGIFNRNNNIIGVLSFGPENFCNVGHFDTYGKFSLNYYKQNVRNTLNPNHDWWVENNGLRGRKITCYSNLELPGAPGVSGHYFPAKHYQPQNTIFLQANNNIDIVRPLHVYNEADYRFRAGNVITINPGFEAETGSTVVFENGLCGGSAKETNPQQQLLAALSKIKIPRDKTFDAQSLAAGTLYGNPQSLVMDVFPNPSNGAFTLRLSEKGDYHITLTDMLGTTVATFQMNGEKETTFHPALSHGQYLIRVSGNGQTAVGKIAIVE